MTRRSLQWPDDARVTVAGLALAALVVMAMVMGSTTLTILTSVIALAGSIVSPLIGMIVLGFLAPLPRPLVIPTPGLHIALIGAILLGVVLRLPIERPRLRGPSSVVLLAIAFLLYASAHFVGGLMDGYPSPRGDEIASLFANLATGILAFAIASIVLRDRSPYPVLTALLAAAVLQSALALSQSMGADVLARGLFAPSDPGSRASASFGDPNYFGTYLAAAATLAVACAVIARSAWMKVSLLTLTAFIGLALLLSMSRGAILAMIAGMVTIAFVRSRSAGLVTVAAALLVVTLAYPAFTEWRFGADVDDASLGFGAEEDASGRINSVAASQELIESSPLFGIGYGRFSEEASTGDAAHNWYANVLAEMGMSGGVMWASFIVALLMALRRRPQSARTVGYSVLAAWMVGSLFLELPMDYQTTGPVLISLGAACVARWAPRPREDTEAAIRAPRSRNARAQIAV